MGDRGRTADSRRTSLTHRILPRLALSISVFSAIAAGFLGRRLHEQKQHAVDIAEKIRHDADTLVDFILNDLRDRLESSGETEMLELAARRALDYLKSVPVEEELPAYRQRRAVALDSLGDLLLQQGDLSGADRALQESLSLSELLAREDPNNRSWQRSVAVTQSKIADLQREQGDLEQAIAMQRLALTVLDQLAQESPDAPDRQYDLSLAHERLGAILEAQGELTEALKAYQARQIIITSLCTQDPTRTDWQHDLAVSYGAVGNVRKGLGDSEGALAAYRKFAELMDQLTARDTDRPEWRHDAGISQEKIGDTLAARGDLNGAAAAYRRFAAISRDLAALDPRHIQFQRDHAAALTRLALISERSGNLAEASRLQQDSSTILESVAAKLGTEAARRELGSTLGRLAWYLLLVRQPDNASATAKRAATLAPGDLKVQLVRAHTLLLSAQPVEAEKIYRAHLGSSFAGTRSWNTAVSDDFRTLISRGIVHPDMRRIERLMKTPNQG